MSSSASSIIPMSRYPGASSMNPSLHQADTRMERRSERAEPSFAETIVGRRGSLRPIFNQVEAVAPTNTPS